MRSAWKFFSRKYSTFSQQIATTSLQKAFKSFQAFYAEGHWGLCSSFLYNTRHDWKKYNQSQLGKEKKRPSSIYLVAKQLPSRVFALKMDKFVLKVKPKKKPCRITPQERGKQYPGKFHADNNVLFRSTCDVAVDHHRKSVLDKHLSAVSHIKRMDESSSKRAKQQTLKTAFKCKTPSHEEKVKVCHEWKEREIRLV